MPRRNHASLVTAYNIPTRDFFTLTPTEVGRVLDAADSVGYRKPRNANGSRARYFHARLMRDLEASRRSGPVVTVHDPRFPAMPHLANLP